MIMKNNCPHTNTLDMSDDDCMFTYCVDCEKTSYDYVINDTQE